MRTHQTPSQGSVVKLGILLSGRGSNCEALIWAIQQGILSGAEIAAVLSNRPEAPGLQKAAEHGILVKAFSIKEFSDRRSQQQAMVQYLQSIAVDWVILAGYDQILSADFVAAFAGRILNIHPSLLPAYGGKGMVGLAVHQAVINAGETQSGCTVHGVTEGVDEGPIFGQAVIPVYPEDTAETLAARVLAEEHQLYPLVIGKLVASTQQAENSTLLTKETKTFPTDFYNRSR